MLTIKDLSVSVKNKQVLHQLSLQFEPGKVYALMGPNGSGKSTLAYSIMGHPAYKMHKGSINMLKCNDESINIAAMKVDERSRAGIFVAFQHAQIISGVKVIDFLKESYHALSSSDIPIDGFHQKARQALARVGLDESFLYRGLNEGFSGGEKKRLEVAQLLLFRPSIAILDEIDSGLDVDAIKKIADALHYARKENPSMSIILITHYQRILHHMTPDVVHILINGHIVRSGDSMLALHVEETGYDGF